jgi:gamma-glutamylputrescine oxidase
MAVADTAWALDYFRLSHDHRLLFGGRASYSALPPPGLRRVMQRRMHQVFPQLADVALDQVWGGYVDITRNRAPHWGRLDGNLYFAQGFSGHGVAAAGLAGEVIAAAIAGQSERLDVFQRLRHAPFPAAGCCARRCWWRRCPGTSCGMRCGEDSASPPVLNVLTNVPQR